jgi:hypothetical protein
VAGAASSVPHEPLDDITPNPPACQGTTTPLIADNLADVNRAPARRRLLEGERLIDSSLSAAVVLLVASPLLFTHNGFAPDFTNHLWLVWYQERFIEAHLHPTLFVSAPAVGLFYPQFLFYGGTLFAATGALGALLGGATIAAFEAVTIGAIAAAYGGLLWLARQLGVRGLKGHAPALVYVTSAYYVTNLYGRGAWPEFIAVSALPLVLAAAVRLVRGPWRFWPVICLTVATVFFSGSHNLTLLWGTLVSAVVLLLLWLFGGRPRKLPVRRLASVGLVLGLSAGLNGWFLIPDVRHASDTVIAGQITPWSATGEFNTVGALFDPLRYVPPQSGTPALFVQTPDWFLLWGLGAGALILLDRRLRRLRGPLFVGLVTLGGLLVLVMSAAPWTLLPRLLREIQFAYRLDTYVALACAGLVLIGVLAMQRTDAARRRWLGATLALAAAASIGLCTWQLWIPNTEIPGDSYPNRGDALASTLTMPRTWYGSGAYGDTSLPQTPVTNTVILDAGLVHDDRFAADVQVPSGTAPFATNITTGPYFVRVGGLQIAGSYTGLLVLARVHPGSGPVRLILTPNVTGAVFLGRLATGLSALGLVAFGLVAFWRRRVSGAGTRSQ